MIGEEEKGEGRDEYGNDERNRREEGRDEWAMMRGERGELSEGEQKGEEGLSRK
jgi:hypothetical protein